MDGADCQIAFGPITRPRTLYRAGNAGPRASCCAKSDTHHATRPTLSACTTEHDTRAATSSADESSLTASTTIGASSFAHMLSEQAEAVDAHNVLSVKHRGRIDAGILYASTSAVPWAILHARTFEHDVLERGEGGGRLRARAVIVDPAVASRAFRGVMGSLVRRIVVRRMHVWPLRGRRRRVRQPETTERDGCVRGVAIWWGFGELRGLRFLVDAGSMACDRGRDPRGR